MKQLHPSQLFFLFLVISTLQFTPLLAAQPPTDSVVTARKLVVKKRITAALLTITMGPLGAHRLYLGCPAHVPVAYVATVGGGVGLIPVLDLFAILFTRNFATLQNNKQVFMWMKPPLPNTDTLTTK